MYQRLTWEAVAEQPLQENEQQLVEEVYERLAIFEETCRPHHEAARITREIIHCRDPFQDKPGAKEKTLQLQTLKSTFNNCVADQMQNMPEARLLPETPEMQEAVDDMQDLVHHVVYEVNNYESIHRRRAEDFYGPGTAVTQIAWDADMSFGKGDIAIIRWPVEAFLWDVQAEDIQDARALMKISWHPMSWYEQHYPDAYQYISAEDGMYNEVGLPEIQQQRMGADEPRAMLVEYWYRRYDASKHRYTINVAYCAGGALLGHDENVYLHGMYPFVVDVHTTEEGSTAGEGLVSELTPMMRYINRYARYIDMNLRMSSKGRMVVRRNSGIDREALADWEQDIVEGDSVAQGEDWNWIQNVPFNGMIANQMLQFQSDLKQDSGVNQFTRGETTGGIVSGKAITALQSAGGKIQQMRTLDLNNGFKQIVKQVLWLMAQFYKDDRVLMVTGRRDNAIRPVTVQTERFFGKRGKGSVAAPPYTVQVEAVSRDPNRIEAQNQMFMQAYTMAAQAQQYFPLSVLFRIMNIEGKDKLLPVIEKNEQQQQVMQQLQQQNQQLVEQLAQMQKQNDNLRMGNTQLTNALASVGATGASGFTPGAMGSKAAEAGGGPETQAALINQARRGGLADMPEMAD